MVGEDLILKTLRQNPVACYANQRFAAMESGAPLPDLPENSKFAPEIMAMAESQERLQPRRRTKD